MPAARHLPLTTFTARFCPSALRTGVSFSHTPSFLPAFILLPFLPFLPCSCCLFFSSARRPCTPTSFLFIPAIFGCAGGSLTAGMAGAGCMRPTLFSPSTTACWLAALRCAGRNIAQGAVLAWRSACICLLTRLPRRVHLLHATHASTIRAGTDHWDAVPAPPTPLFFAAGFATLLLHTLFCHYCPLLYSRFTLLSRPLYYTPYSLLPNTFKVNNIPQPAARQVLTAHFVCLAGRLPRVTPRVPMPSRRAASFRLYERLHCRYRLAPHLRALRHSCSVPYHGRRNMAGQSDRMPFSIFTCMADSHRYSDAAAFAGLNALYAYDSAEHGCAPRYRSAAHLPPARCSIYCLVDGRCFFTTFWTPSGTRSPPVRSDCHRLHHCTMRLFGACLPLAFSTARAHAAASTGRYGSGADGRSFFTSDVIRAAPPRNKPPCRLRAAFEPKQRV